MASNHPGYNPADDSTVSGSRGPARLSAGTASGADPTNEPGQYPPGDDHGIFGGALPTSTGAPGSAGAPRSQGDVTAEPGQTLSFDGASQSAIVNTGAPGTSGVSPDLGGGGDNVSFTRPGSYLSGTYSTDEVNDQISGPEDWTQANDGGYAAGGPKMPGVAGNEPEAGGGRFQPGGGSVMRGGRMKGGG